MDKCVDVSPPFESCIHLLSPAICCDQLIFVQELRALLELNCDYDEKWCTDKVLNLFLIARCNRVHDAFKMMLIAKEWRDHRKPHDVKDWEYTMQRESETGKIYCPCMIINA